MRRLAAACLAAAAAGCAPALREPPTVAVLAAQKAPAVRPGARDADSLLREADALWARRPDADAVRQAESLYLAAADADDRQIAGLIGAVRVKVWRVDRETDVRVREELATSAVHAAQWCGRRAPDEPMCDYWLAIAVGVQAREVRQTAEDGLKTMIAALKRAIEKIPTYEAGGPDRVMALLLLRAPGWPLGPGDPEQALAHAAKAVALAPDEPQNVLAQAEALVANKQRERGTATYRKALTLARERAAAGDPDAAEWIVEATDALER